MTNSTSLVQVINTMIDSSIQKELPKTINKVIVFEKKNSIEVINIGKLSY